MKFMIKLEVEIVRQGQVRKYAGHENEYIVSITSDPQLGEIMEAVKVEDFCTTSIKRPVRFKDSPCPFDSTETIEKIEQGKYRYKQSIPSTH